jgi:hypothetical protein
MFVDTVATRWRRTDDNWTQFFVRSRDATPLSG